MEKIIEVKNLVKKFNDFTAVDDISFNVEQGQIFAFLGPNGAGKTTTIKILTTLLNKTQGDVKVNGFNVEQDSNLIRKSFGIVFQDPSLDEELTAYENLYLHGALYGVPKKERVEKINQMLKFIGLFDKKDVFVKKYSGGMKRKLEIARALIHTPKILFLDEPTLGLDPQTRNNLWEYIKQLNKENNMTVFFTTHYIEEAQKSANMVAVIDHGKIIKQDTPKNIMKSTKSKTLEEAFLKLTGYTIREEEASGIDGLRQINKVWRR